MRSFKSLMKSMVDCYRGTSVYKAVSSASINRQLSSYEVTKDDLEFENIVVDKRLDKIAHDQVFAGSGVTMESIMNDRSESENNLADAMSHLRVFDATFESDYEQYIEDESVLNNLKSLSEIDKNRELYSLKTQYRERFADSVNKATDSYDAATKLETEFCQKIEDVKKETILAKEELESKLAKKEELEQRKEDLESMPDKTVWQGTKDLASKTANKVDDKFKVSDKATAVKDSAIAAKDSTVEKATQVKASVVEAGKSGVEKVKSVKDSVVSKGSKIASMLKEKSVGIVGKAKNSVKSKAAFMYKEELAQLKAYKAENKDLKSSVEDLESYKEENKFLKDGLNARHMIIDNQVKVVDELTTSNEELKQENETLTAKYEGLNSDFNQLVDMSEHYMNENEGILSDRDATISKLKSSVESAKKRTKAKNATISKLKSEVESKSNEAESYKAKYNDLLAKFSAAGIKEPFDASYAVKDESFVVDVESSSIEQCISEKSSLAIGDTNIQEIDQSVIAEVNKELGDDVGFEVG